MDSSAAREGYPGLREANFNPKNAVTWIEQKPAAIQVSYAHDICEELLQDAARPKQSSGHACVKLCGFIEQCFRSGSPTLREYASTEETASVLFNFYVEWNEQDQHRSMRLVLDFLKISILNNPDPQVGRAVKTRLLTDIVSFITVKSVKPAVKSALTALDYFVQKNVFYLSDVIQTYCHVHHIQTEQPHESWDAFISTIFGWMEMQHVCPVAGKLLATIFSKPWYENQDVRFLPESWHKFLCAGLQVDIELLQPIQLYTLMPLFSSDKQQMLIYLDYLHSLQTLTKDQSGLDLTSMIWLAALEAGKKLGIVGEPDSGDPVSDGVAHLQPEVLEDILSHNSQEARSSAVSILIASPSTTKPYTIASLDLLQKHLPAFYADSDAKFRYDVLGYSRNMIARTLGATAGLTKELDRKLKKAKKNDDGIPESEEITKLRHALRSHNDFFSWYLGFLENELVPTASYQRHITSLKAMEFILRSNLNSNPKEKDQQAQKFSLVNVSWLRSVLDLVMDPFDDVRETAAGLLVQLYSKDIENPVHGLSTPVLQELEEFCTRASVLASKTSRADHSDGVARSYEILCQWTTSINEKLAIPARILEDLERKLSTAETDLASAVLEAPIHGGFAALRHVWQSLSNIKYNSAELEILAALQSRAISCCDRIWQAVRIILCDDSPEGHLPEELEEVDELDTKDLLSYSFRAIHESSHLLRVIANNARSQKSGSVTPKYDEFETIGNLTFDQLSNLRHRGAFTTVSQTFTSCCQLVKYFSVPPGQETSLLDKWYQGALDCIYNQASTTRRSAGIPALIVGILSSGAEQPAFDAVIHNLQDIARRPARIAETDGSNLPQVHATNCIKDIFKSSMLSRRAEPYLTECLELAATSLKSEVWAIRNCGLILLRSLIDCLFGTSESKTLMEAGWDGRSTRVAWHKYKTLPALLVSLLKSGQTTTGVSTEMATAESVFPALDIIRRAGPPQEFKDELYGIVAWYLGSHIWHVREIAARTLCSFLLQAEWFDHIKDLLTESYSSANRIHGALLTFKFLLERLLDTMPEQLFKHYPDTLLDFIVEVQQTPGSLQTCPEARAVHSEIVTSVNGLRSNEKFSDRTSGVELLEVELKESTASANSTRVIPSALMESKQAQEHAALKMEQLLLSPPGNSDCSTLDIKRWLRGDVNVACDALQTILTYVETAKAALFSTTVAPQLIEICTTTLHHSESPEARILALQILAVQLDRSVDQGVLSSLPSKEELISLWSQLQSKPLNPGLADAIIRTSGPLIKAVIALSKDDISQSTEQWLKHWGIMMINAGSVDNGFDTRMAGIQGIQSFTSRMPSTNNSAANIPWLMALYDYLNDDDEEIRDIAAAATAPILGKPLVSIEASVRLLSWIAQNYGTSEEFHTHVACRMIGHPAVSTQLTDAELGRWTPADTQLAKAMRFDDSLFVVEEQNLYIDEVREAMRWRNVYLSLSYPEESKAIKALVQWTSAGLQTLSKLAEERDDGALGWTSKPEVFAICSRIVVASVALAGKHESLKIDLDRFVNKGKAKRVHGLLLGMCESAQ